jgi:sugar phosphate isomerase/epimerase
MKPPRRSFKGSFPFRLATTSFIYPEDYVPNVRRLAGRVDEIELLFFESRAVPSAAVIRELADIGRGSGLTYNVHLPLDVSIGHPGRRRREGDVERLLAILERAAPLSPTTHTLHVPAEPEAPSQGPAAASREGWPERVRESLAAMLRRGVDPGRLSIENLDYPLERLAGEIAGLGLKVCMDVGHLLLNGFGIGPFYKTFSSAIDVIHLHGAAGGREHLPADRLPPAAERALRPILAGYRQTLVLEVFRSEHLEASLAWLAARFSGPRAAS